jgi:cytochrome c556
MLNSKKNNVLLVTLTLMITTSLYALADSSTKSAEILANVTLKSVMQGLLKETQQLTQGIILQDFSLIAQSASKIADHPTPSMMTKIKLMKALGTDMVKFKSKDDVVHNSSVAIVKYAQEKNLAAIQQKYQIMIDGCVACHSEFKEKVASILNK